MRYCNGWKYRVEPSARNLRNLYDQPLILEGTIMVDLTIDMLLGLTFAADLFVISNMTLEADVILRREFLHRHRLTLVYKPADEPTLLKMNLFSVLPLHVLEDYKIDLEIIINCDVDFDAKRKLKAAVLEIDDSPVSEINDGYAVQIRLKDNSVYAYAPRRFARTERLQLHEITDDLLERDIIKPNVSPYYVQGVSVHKQNGKLRLCVDLSPLNDRVERQRYSVIPVIKECLSRLANNEVFTLLKEERP